MRRNVDDFSDDVDCWLNAGQPSFDAIWDNSDDDIYAALSAPDARL